MAKTVKKKKAVVKANRPRNREGPPTIDVLMKRLKGRIGAKGVAKAEELAKTLPLDVLNLAYRLGGNTVSLTKPQQKFYEEMKADNPQAAEKWKTKKLAERAKK